MDAFSWDEDPELYTIQCDWCGISHPSSRGFVLRDKSAHAIFHTEWHPKHLVAYVEITVGDFSEETWASNVTFGVQLRPPEAESVDPVVLFQSSREPENRVFGDRPDVDQAMSHPRVSDMWAVLEWIVVNDPLLAGKFPTHN